MSNNLGYFEQKPIAMATTIDQYLTLTISDLRRFGYLKSRAAISGRISWESGGVPVASVIVTTDTRALPMCYFQYKYNGEEKEEQIRLMFKHSNFNPDGEHGYYYFVCPVTGKCCRKLYNVGGRFVGRSAFRALYPKQTQSRKQREETARVELLLRLGKMFNSRYRKDYYKGKPTPQRLRWERYIERNRQKEPIFSQL